jgi:uncharacterized membrane protein YphA (DoxX/SURF4 family)
MNQKIVLGLRIALGVAMVGFGVGKFFSGPPQADAMGEGMYAIMTVLHSPFMLMIGVLEVVSGLALLVGKFIPVALTLSIAIMFNAFMLHIFYDPKNYLFSLIFLILGIVSVYAHKEKFKLYLSA